MVTLYVCLLTLVPFELADTCQSYRNQIYVASWLHLHQSLSQLSSNYSWHFSRDVAGHKKNKYLSILLHSIWSINCYFFQMLNKTSVVRALNTDQCYHIKTSLNNFTDAWKKQNFSLCPFLKVWQLNLILAIQDPMEGCHIEKCFFNTLLMRKHDFWPFQWF